MEVILFDLDFKIQLSTLLQCILSKLNSIVDEQKRIQLYKEAIDRVTVFRPADICHFSLILDSLLLLHSSSFIEFGSLKKSRDWL